MLSLEEQQLKIENLERKTEDLGKKTEEVLRLLKTHTHSGLETSGRLEPKSLKLFIVDAVKYLAGGTEPYTDGTYYFSTASGKVAYITIKSGIIISISITP